MSETGRLRGIASMVGAVALFALMDSGLKLLSPHYPPMQVAALRGLASLPLVFVWALADGGFAQLVRVRWALHLLRGVLAVVMLAAFAYALRLMPLAEAYAIFFVAPLLITAIAALFLREEVGWRRWTAIGVGMCGVLIVLKPSGAGMLTLGGAAMLVAALGYSVSAIAVRVLGRTDSTQSMVFWMLAMLSLFATIAAWNDWKAIRPEDWWVLAGIGATGAVGQFLVTYAFSASPASIVAPFEYTALAWAMALDWVLWKTLPDARMLAGAAVIVLAGLYLLRRERVHTEAEHP
ncbi:DMT family transporter [Tahibacter soli]|jgi:drug/metabolite transporter (DMT)-like permease|uniref:DMT family transporter n=1 Tax=Tahibacter soli TaxID=2983605 RepID=A0A9X3YKK8_9GAMM|nr:DMT family transporter [Tahibacter soli]MDC8012378.1 DMT family transporter [Tahibacter soli]